MKNSQNPASVELYFPPFNLDPLCRVTYDGSLFQLVVVTLLVLWEDLAAILVPGNASANDLWWDKDVTTVWYVAVTIG